MRITTKLVTAVAAAAVVAGVGLAAPAQAANTAKKSAGVTLISFDKNLAKFASHIHPTDPAKLFGPRLTFPVAGTSGNIVVTHSGAFTLGNTPLDNPIVEISGKYGTFALSFDGNSIPFFTMAHIKKTVDAKTGATIYEGTLNLTTNQEYVNLLIQSTAFMALKPGMGLGKFRTTINR